MKSRGEMSRPEKENPSALVGVVVVGHGRLALEMVETLSSVVGPLAGVQAVVYQMDADPEEIRGSLRDAVEAVDTGAGAIIFTDMLGDTACNASMQVAEQRQHVEVLAGVNMPMLIKLTTARMEMRAAPDLASFIRRYGQDHICWPTGDRSFQAGAGC